MNPGTLFSYVSNFNHIWVNARSSCSFSECCFVHTRRTGANYDTCKVMFLNCIDDHILTCLRTHILIIGGKDHTGFVLQGIGNGLHVHGAGDVTAAPTYKYTNSLHCLFLLYFVYLRNALTSSCWGVSSSIIAGMSLGVR